MSFNTSPNVNQVPQIVTYPISGPGSYGWRPPLPSPPPSPPLRSILSLSPPPYLRILKDAQPLLPSLSPFIAKKIEPLNLEPLNLEPFNLEPFNLEPLNLETLFIKQQKDVIIIARPLSELFSHLKHFKLPSIELIARVIKTLVLSIFRGHLCDQALLKQEGVLNLNTIYYNFDGKTSAMAMDFFKGMHPYLLENAYFLTLKGDDEPEKQSNVFSHPCVSPDTLRQHFKDCYEIEITDKETGNTISDLFKSVFFTLETYQD